ncbi:MAG TPA: UvrD-helicase domain-containing protein [Aggregatilineaceae bacterium]|nr:UvrD-helicase domain-containing protein [Aggregatilineaceae bacterium]
MNFTPEQHDAIFIHEHNLIVTAGAGSGKTRVLVERFVALLQTNPGWPLPAVVAVTFTEKAAREMRDRVRQTIETLIRRALDEQDSDNLERWLEHQGALNRARIGTVHALCAQILRANPAEAGIDPSFTVLDENEAGILLDDAVDQAMARMVLEGQTGLLVLYDPRIVRQVLRDHATWGAAQAVEEAFGRGNPLDVWQAMWTEAQRDLIEEAQPDEAVRAALNWQPANGWPPDDDKLMENWILIEQQRDGLASDDPAVFAVAAETLAQKIVLKGGKKGDWGGDEGFEVCKQKLTTVRDWAKGVRLFTRLGQPDQQSADVLGLWRDAIRLAADEYHKLKQGALDFDDLEARTRDLLNAYPQVAARYADEFRQVLVDEFQDTNLAQRDIVYRLAGEQSGRLFVVGDPKQSIYAFRGADVSVFGKVREDMIARAGRELPLAMSFRTHERLVAAFNALFGQVLRVGRGPAARYEVALDQPMLAFRPSEPAIIPQQAQPIQIFVFEKPDKERFPHCQRADEMRQWEARTLATTIHQMVADGTLVWDRELAHDDPAAVHVPAFAHARGAYRKMNYGDVVVLFQAMTRAPLYEEVFKAEGLPYVTVAGKGYYDRQEVRDLLHLLNALHNPADDLALAVVLRSPLFGLSDDALYALRLAQNEEGQTLPLWEALLAERSDYFPWQEDETRAFAVEVLRELREIAGRVTMAELLQRALQLTGYLATLTGLSDGARRRGNVEKLLKVARESGRVSLGAFTAYAREMTARDVREGEAAVEVEGAVTLMSVHASKGLEFPVVILADASWTRGDREGTFVNDPDVGPACKLPDDDPNIKKPQSFAWEWAGKLAERRDRAERKRLLYVGATRAQDYLIISGAVSSRSKEGWLTQCLEAVGENTDHQRDDCLIRKFDEPPVEDAWAARPAETMSTWDDPAIGRALDGAEAQLPPLLQAVPVDPTAAGKALTATHIAKLGRVPYFDPRARGRAAFRHAVLFDAPEPLRPLPEQGVNDATLHLIIGDMVHRALQAWLMPTQMDQHDLELRLQTYAWEHNLSEPSQVHQAVDRAVDLLKRFEQSDMAQSLNAAKQVYRELPFVYDTGRRTIHGVIDVLFFNGREWHVLDYKTAPVAFNRTLENAQQYYLQVGVYAAAVAAKTGQFPGAHLYYIHPARLISVRPEQWRAALDRLDEDVQAALEE